MSCIYMSVTLEKRHLTFDEELSAMRSQKYSSTKEIPVDKEVVVRLNTTDIAILAFVVCLLLSLILALVYKAFFAEHSHVKESAKEESKSHADVEFTEGTSDEEFDYPYEDMDEVLGERKWTY